MSRTGPFPAPRPLARIVLRRVAAPAAAPRLPAWKALRDPVSLVGLTALDERRPAA